MASSFLKGLPVVFSYTQEFEDNLVKTSAYRNIEKEKNKISNTVSSKGRGGVAIMELNRMIGLARDAERQFLITHNLKDPHNNWNKLITEINKLLSTEAVFKRNVQLLKQFSNKDIKVYEDVSVYFRQKLEKAIFDVIEVDVNASMDQILEQAVIKAIKSMANITEFQMEDNTIRKRNSGGAGKVLQAFSELFQVVEVFLSSEFLLKINEIFQLKEYIEEVRSYLLNPANSKEKKPRLKYTNGAGGKGTLAEILYTAVERGLGSGSGGNGIEWRLVEQTGGLNFKPDRVLSTIEVSYNQSAETVKENDINYGGSNRARGIATMEQFYKDLAEAKGDIVLISDKNYIINQAFENGTDKREGGFTAQGETSLNALSGLFNSLHINIFDIDALINYLANIGGNLIEKDIDDSILRAISAQVGNFLFDDLSFDASAIPVGVNAIHVFQLSGLYVPLSIVLEGVKRGIGNIQNTDLSSFVEVSFKASSSIPGAWTTDNGEEAFTDFRNAKMKENSISVHFLKGFASIIADNVIF